MVRVLIETSLPARALGGVETVLAEVAQRADLDGRIEVLGRGAACEGQASGGEAEWTPCWITLSGDSPERERLLEALGSVKELVARACREEGVELFTIPANAQIGDAFYRFKDLLDVGSRLP